MYVCLMGHIWRLVGQGRLCQSFMQFAVSSSLNIHTHKKNVADYSQMWIWVVNTWVFILLFSACVLSCFSRVQLFETPWTVAPQAPPSMGFSRQEYWSGVPCPPPGGPPHPGTGLTPPVFPALQADSLPLSCLGSPFYFSTLLYIWKFS